MKRTIQNFQPIQINLTSLSMALNDLLLLITTCKRYARIAYKRKSYKLWSKLMNKIKQARKHLKVIAYKTQYELFWMRKTSIIRNTHKGFFVSVADTIAAINYARTSLNVPRGTIEDRRNIQSDLA